jgi:outer membrane lipoprotein-sorting protein
MPAPADLGTELLETAETRMMTDQGLRFDFSYSIVDPYRSQARIADVSGHIRFSQGRYVVSTPTEVLYCNLTRRWIYYKRENTYREIRYEPDYDLTFEVVYQLFRNADQAEYQGQESLDGEACQKVKLSLQDSQLDHTDASVWIDPETKWIRKLVLIDHQQVRTTYHFRNVRSELPLSSQDFIFDPDEYGAKKI